MSARSLDSVQILPTLRRLEQRIAERFPARGILSICQDLIAIGEQAQVRAVRLSRPNVLLRALVYLVIAAALAGLIVITWSIKVQVGNTEIFGLFQGVEAAANIVVLLGAALFFLVSLERRLKRSRTLADLHVFRSIAHVIDMHQLTKDPSIVLTQGPPTASSPVRIMNRFELSRYLDYCSEMLSLTAKLAALYAQNLPDPVVVEAVNDIERLTTNLSNKIWQKITILDNRGA